MTPPNSRTRGAAVSEPQDELAQAPQGAGPENTSVSQEEATVARARGLLLASAWIRPPATLLDSLAASCDSKTWELAAAASEQVHLEPLFLAFMEAHFPEAPLSPETRTRLETQKRLHAFRWDELRETMEDVLEALQTHGPPPILLKGVATLGDLYDPPRLRPMRDLDLLIHPDALEAAHRTLLARHFVPSPELPDEDYRAHHHLAPVFHPSTGVCVELHRHPLCARSMLPGVPPPEDYWKTPGVSRASLVAGNPDEPAAAVLSPTLQFLVTTLHFTHGDHIGGRITHLVDLSRLLELHGPEVDWDRLVGYAQSPGLASSFAFSLGYLAREGLPTAPEAILDAFQRIARLRKWESRLLFALMSRYRVGLPGPWPGISPRIGNILWHSTLTRAPLGRRWLFTAQAILSRGRQSREQQRRRRALAD